jgi:hypothetical protein
MSWETEYKESSENFRKGFQLIFDIAKSFVTVNGFLFGALAVANIFGIPGAPKFSLAIFLVCGVGLLSCIATFIAHYRIGAYVRTFLLRAKEIEDRLNETNPNEPHALYKYIYDFELAGRSRIFNNYRIPLLAYAIVGVFWILLLLGYLGVRNLSVI